MDSQGPQSSGVSSTIHASGGPLFTTIATERKVLTYAVTKPEMENLSILNSLSALFFSIGTGLLGFAADSLRDWISANPTPAARVIVLACGALALLCYGIGVFMWRKRSSVLKDIISTQGTSN